MDPDALFERIRERRAMSERRLAQIGGLNVARLLEVAAVREEIHQRGVDAAARMLRTMRFDGTDE
jgi:hypothetical protein